MTRTLIDGRIPQTWDLPMLRARLARTRRLTAAPDPRDAADFRRECDELARAITETEAQRETA